MSCSYAEIVAQAGYLQESIRKCDDKCRVELADVFENDWTSAKGLFRPTVNCDCCCLHFPKWAHARIAGILKVLGYFTCGVPLPQPYRTVRMRWYLASIKQS